MMDAANCAECHTQFSRKDKMMTHYKYKHGNEHQLHPPPPPPPLLLFLPPPPSPLPPPPPSSPPPPPEPKRIRCDEYIDDNNDNQCRLTI